MSPFYAQFGNKIKCWVIFSFNRLFERIFMVFWTQWMCKCCILHKYPVLLPRVLRLALQRVADRARLNESACTLMLLSSLYMCYRKDFLNIYISIFFLIAIECKKIVKTVCTHPVKVILIYNHPRSMIYILKVTIQFSHSPFPVNDE